MTKKKIEKETAKLERKKDKIEIYASKIVKEFGGKVLVEKMSTYYNINGRILRISNHIGQNSSGHLSIIIPSYDSSKKSECNYIMHAHQTGEISIMNYEDVKEMIRCYGKMSSIVSNPYQANFEFQFEVRDKFDAKLAESKLQTEMDRLRTIEKKYEKLLEKTNEKDSDKTTHYDSMTPDELFGVPIRYFTDGQMNMFRCTARTALKTAINKNKLPEDKEKLKVLESIIK